MKKAAFKTLRAEIRAIVDEAHRAGKPIGSHVIWGLVTRELPESRIAAEINVMVKCSQLVSVIPPEGYCADSRIRVYEPGPVAVVESGRARQGDQFMGNMEHMRLIEAREVARKWLRGEVAA